MDCIKLRTVKTFFGTLFGIVKQPSLILMGGRNENSILRFSKAQSQI
jgi:hypothetical protein